MSPSFRGAKARGPDRSSDAAVSDIVGSLLLVGLTVGMTVILAVLLFAYRGPSPAPQAHLAIDVQPGEGGWGTGDELVVVRHLGGAPLDRHTHLGVRIGSGPGATVADLSGAALGPPFDDGRLSIGETWTHAWRIASSDLVQVDVIGAADTSTALLASATLVAGSVPA